MLAQRYEFYVQVAKTISISLTVLTREILFLPQEHKMQARRRGGGGGFKGFERTPLEANNGGLKTQTVDFQLLASSGGMENKL